METPAWQYLGAAAWADLSRRADLGPGMFVYPKFEIASYVIVLATAISFSPDRRANRAVFIPINLAALFSILAAATTIIAAPTMISIKGLALAAPAVGEAFVRFTLWGVYVRGAAFALSFLASLAALVAL